MTEGPEKQDRTDRTNRRDWLDRVLMTLLITMAILCYLIAHFSLADLVAGR